MMQKRPFGAVFFGPLFYFANAYGASGLVT